MKITRKQWKAYQSKLSSLSKKATDEMLAWITAQGGYTAVEFEAAIAQMYAIATRYGEASAAISALMYDTMADLSGAAVPGAEVASTASLAEVKKAVYGASTFSQNDEYISAIAGRLVKQAGADTTLKNAKRDGAEFAWIPSGDTCAFCQLLAAEGWQRASKDTIKGGHAEHIHANCDCQFMIRFDSETTVEGYKPDPDLYKDTEGRTMEEKANTIRRENYEKNKDEINAQKRITYRERTQELNSSEAEED